jgi:hypothetical protein
VSLINPFLLQTGLVTNPRQHSQSGRQTLLEFYRKPPTGQTESKMVSRFLPYAFANDGTGHRMQPPATYGEVCEILTREDWKCIEGEKVFLYIHDEKENLFVIIPEGSNFEVNVQIKDRFGILGSLGRDQKMTLSFGILEPTDTQRLLKLFFDENYPAQRSLTKSLY